MLPSGSQAAARRSYDAETRFSALGQKQTYAPQQAMSALPPKATAKADMPQWSCPLYTIAADRVCSRLVVLDAPNMQSGVIEIDLRPFQVTSLDGSQSKPEGDPIVAAEIF